MEDINGLQYATLAAGAEKEQALLDLCRCFHPYLMKYLVMICRGHVPVYAGRVNQDAKNFIRYFLPRGSALNAATMGKAIRHLHLAFNGMETEEIYDVLMEQFVRAAAKYDPHYTDKVKEVVEVIENALSGARYFSIVDLRRHLEFDCARHLRLLCRRGFLVSAPGREENHPGSARHHVGFDRRATADRLPAGFTGLPMGPDRS